MSEKACMLVEILPLAKTTRIPESVARRIAAMFSS
jgi:hypothetical protein